MNSVVDDWLPRHLINVDEYYRMAEVGLLAPDARVELISGVIIDMAPNSPRHASVDSLLTKLLIDAVGDRALVSVAHPVRLDRRSETHPDLTLLKPRADFYASAHPVPDDVLLLIEISDTTLRYVRDVKLPLYAAHAIPEVWLIDLMGRQLLCSRKPVDGRYTELTIFDSGSMEPSLLPGATIDLSFVFSLLG
jgi:Uma2 family endonuclease